MYAPRVFVSMMGVLVAFAVAAYFMSGSVYSAFVQTVICAVLLQAGYFVGIVYLVRQEKNRRLDTSPESAAAKRALDSRGDDLHADAAINLKISDT